MRYKLHYKGENYFLYFDQGLTQADTALSIQVILLPNQYNFSKQVFIKQYNDSEHVVYFMATNSREQDMCGYKIMFDRCRSNSCG